MSLSTFPVFMPSQLSVHIRALRKARGMTQTALGQRIGVKQARMAEIERNPGSVSLEQLMQVLHALDARLQLVDTTRYAQAEPTPPLVANSPAADW